MGLTLVVHSGKGWGNSYGGIRGRMRRSIVFESELGGV